MSSEAQLFITCAPTLEPLLCEELKAMGIPDTHVGFRGVYVEKWNWNTIYQINYASRLATRVLLPLSRFRCFDQKSLYRHTSELDWSPIFKEGLTFAIDANVHHRELRNSLFAAQVMKDAICDQLRNKTGRRPSVQTQNPDIQLNLFIQQQTAVISFDTSGEALHKRGYRQESVEAPIKETLAAALLHLAKYQADDVLFDPCCGSGTILIEAALMATKTPPGFLRRQWGFMHHPRFNTIEWLQVKNAIDADRIPLQKNRISGIDISRNSVRATKINLKAAGFHHLIPIEISDFREYRCLPTPNLIVTNPPHGGRLDDEEQLRPLYRALGQFMKESCSKPGRGYIFTGNLELAKEVGLAANRRYELSNGGIDSRLLEYNFEPV
ncbi:MAG: THUMP domain-containing protein [Parachlamydiaceae bacterium]|nr:THUMP domain-containing protein [Parachlamydiaceae bacterium]